MEDAHTAFLQLPNTDTQTAFFAVFDGHGGTSTYTLLWLFLWRWQNCKIRWGAVTFKTCRHPTIQTWILQRRTKRSLFCYWRWLAKGLLLLLVCGCCLILDPAFKDDTSGCTAVSCLITNDKIIVVYLLLVHVCCSFVRQMLVILVVSLELMEKLFLSRKIISLLLNVPLITNDDELIYDSWNGQNCCCWWFRGIW